MCIHLLNMKVFFIIRKRSARRQTPVTLRGQHNLKKWSKLEKKNHQNVKYKMVHYSVQWTHLSTPFFFKLMQIVQTADWRQHTEHTNSYRLQRFSWTMEPLWWFVHLNKSYLSISLLASQSNPTKSLYDLCTLSHSHGLDCELTESVWSCREIKLLFFWLCKTLINVLEHDACWSSVIVVLNWIDCTMICTHSQSVSQWHMTTGRLDFHCDGQFGLLDINSEFMCAKYSCGWLRVNKSGSQRCTQWCEANSYMFGIVVCVHFRGNKEEFTDTCLTVIQ